MAFQVSPGVNVTEIDLTTVVPAVSTTEGALAGVFRWGPVGKRILVDSESNLATRFGKPTNFNPETFFTAANFLAYGNKLYVVRTANTTDATGVNGALSAFANVGVVTSNSNLVIRNDDDINNTTVLSAVGSETNVRYVARYPGSLGNSLKISVCDTSNAFFSNTALVSNSSISSNGDLTSVVATNGSNTFTVTVGQSGTGTIADAVARATSLRSLLSVSDLVELGNTTVGTQLVKVTSIGSVSNTATQATFTVNTQSSYTLNSVDAAGVANVSSISAGYLKRYWEFSTTVDKAPGV